MSDSSIFYQELFKLRDEEYRVFNQKLVPNISMEKMIGVRIPAIRNLAKILYKKDRQACNRFMAELPHKYFEENNLHACIIEQVEDLDEVLNRTEAFLPYIDNWATCDIFSPKIFKKHPDRVMTFIKKCLNSKACYTVRFGIGLLLSDFLDKEFKTEHLELVAAQRSEEYYANMMIAWYFSTALAKQWEACICILEENRLDSWTHNKAIQKAIESRRISDERKTYLRTLKITNKS